MKYGILTADRKEIVRKLEEMTGKRPRYTGMPAAAYELDGITIGNDRTVTAGEDADMGLIGQLVEAGLISGEQDAEDNDDEEPAEIGAPDWNADDMADVGEHAGADAEGNAGDDEGNGDSTEPDPEAMKPEISFPLEKHGRDSIINLVFTIYSKGSLISKSTGGAFKATKELVEKLQASDPGGKEDAIKAIQEDGGLSGISFDEEKATFDGFIPTADPEEARAWTALAAAINRNAIEQKHVRPKEADGPNEKYAFRTWLTRIGMKGTDTKMERKILYRNLSGHTAFRTEEDREKWNAMMKAKREAREAGSADGSLDPGMADGTADPDGAGE